MVRRELCARFLFHVRRTCWCSFCAAFGEVGRSNSIAPSEVKRAFDRLAARDYVGQQQSWNYVGPILAVVCWLVTTSNMC